MKANNSTIRNSNQDILDGEVFKSKGFAVTSASLSLFLEVIFFLCHSFRVPEFTVRKLKTLIQTAGSSLLSRSWEWSYRNCNPSLRSL